MARVGFADQKMERVAKNGKREKRKKRRSEIAKETSVACVFTKPASSSPVVTGTPCFARSSLVAKSFLEDVCDRRFFPTPIRLMKETMSNNTSQIRGRESSKFMELVSPSLIIG